MRRSTEHGGLFEVWSMSKSEDVSRAEGTGASGPESLVALALGRALSIDPDNNHALLTKLIVYGPSGNLFQRFDRYWLESDEQFLYLRYPKDRQDDMWITTSKGDGAKEVLIADLKSDNRHKLSEPTLHLNSDGSPIGTDYEAHLICSALLAARGNQVRWATDKLINIAKVIAAKQAVDQAVVSAQAALAKLRTMAPSA